MNFTPFEDRRNVPPFRVSQVNISHRFSFPANEKREESPPTTNQVESARRALQGTR